MGSSMKFKVGQLLGSIHSKRAHSPEHDLAVRALLVLSVDKNKNTYCLLCPEESDMSDVDIDTLWYGPWIEKNFEALE